MLKTRGIQDGGAGHQIVSTVFDGEGLLAIVKATDMQGALQRDGGLRVGGLHREGIQGWFRVVDIDQYCDTASVHEVMYHHN
jgi:hypothetical protein